MNDSLIEDLDIAIVESQALQQEQEARVKAFDGMCSLREQVAAQLKFEADQKKALEQKCGVTERELAGANVVIDQLTANLKAETENSRVLSASVASKTSALNEMETQLRALEQDLEASQAQVSLLRQELDETTLMGDSLIEDLDEVTQSGEAAVQVAIAVAQEKARGDALTAELRLAQAKELGDVKHKLDSVMAHNKRLQEATLIVRHQALEATCLVASAIEEHHQGHKSEIEATWASAQAVEIHAWKMRCVICPHLLFCYTRAVSQDRINAA